MTQKSLIKMQIWPIKIQILKNRLGTYLIGQKWRFWKKKFFGYLSKKIWFRVCSVTAEMFGHRNSGEIEGKEAKFLSKIYEGHIRIWFRSKKNSKLSHACVPLTKRSACQCRKVNLATRLPGSNNVNERKGL